MIRHYLADANGSRSYLPAEQDKLLSPCKLLIVGTLAERIEWILENCRDDSGEKWNAKTLSLAAGLSQAVVGQIKRGDVKDVGGQTLWAIARTAKVSYFWLGTGGGHPRNPDVPGVDMDFLEPGETYESLHLWPVLLRTAKVLAPNIEPPTWEKVGKGRVLYPGQPVTAQTLVCVAELVMKTMPPAEKSIP